MNLKLILFILKVRNETAQEVGSIKKQLTMAELNIMKDKIEEKIEYNDKGVLCRFNWETKGWEPIEDHCDKCGEIECDCEESFSAIAILKQAVAGGGEQIKYVFVVLLYENEIHFLLKEELLMVM